MFEVNQVVFNAKSFPITRHVIDEKVKVVDGDGHEKYLYHMSGYSVYFSEEEMINRFSTIVEAA